MTDPEGIRIHHFNLSPERHEGLSFVDETDGYTTSIENLCEDSENPGMTIGNLALSDVDGPIGEPLPVVIPQSEIEAGNSLIIYLKDHRGQIAAGSAIIASIAFGTLYVKHRKQK